MTRDNVNRTNHFEATWSILQQLFDLSGSQSEKCTVTNLHSCYDAVPVLPLIDHQWLYAESSFVLKPSFICGWKDRGGWSTENLLILGWGGFQSILTAMTLLFEVTEKAECVVWDQPGTAWRLKQIRWEELKKKIPVYLPSLSQGEKRKTDQKKSKSKITSNKPKKLRPKFPTNLPNLRALNKKPNILPEKKQQKQHIEQPQQTKTKASGHERLGKKRLCWFVY